MIWSVLLARRDRLDRAERHLVVGGEHGVDVGVRLQDVLHRADRLLAVEVARDLLDDLDLAAGLLQPGLDAVDALDPDLRAGDAGDDRERAAVVHLLGDVAARRAWPPSKFSVPT